MLSLLCKSHRKVNSFSLLKLVILRHGQSECNMLNKWSGWSDINLTAKGQQQAVECAKIIKAEGLQFDVAYCSYLNRAVHTLDIVLQQLQMTKLTKKSRWRLNQKHYGSLQSAEKRTIVDKFGKEVVNEWRRSYLIAPPVIFPEDPRHPTQDQKYKHIDPSLLPNSQHLGHVLERVNILYQTEIKSDLLSKKRVLIVCHGSTIRVLSNILLNFGHKQSSAFNIPNATPLMLELNDDLKVQNWKMLGDQSKIKELMIKIERQLDF